jgi:DNA invertase Pin-like site-specific DNA recombinase
MKAAIYARVSTFDQRPEMQTVELSKFCQARNWEITGYFVDRGISGGTSQRPQLDQLMQAAHQRKFEAVLVWKFDRFARSLSHLVQALETFRALGIEFISLTEGIDTTTPAGKMTFAIMGAVAEFERDLIRERVTAGLRAARARGQKLGRPRVTVDPYQVADLRHQGQSWKEISKKLTVSSGTARRALQTLAKKPPETKLRSALESI